jgi:hypothetical protein
MAEYATVDTINDEADIHIRGTIPRAGGKLEFWLTAPRPKDISADEWERKQQEKWDRIFKRSV